MPTSRFNEQTPGTLLMSWVCCLLKSQKKKKQTTKVQKSYLTESGEAKDKRRGKEKRWHRLWDRERERETSEMTEGARGWDAESWEREKWDTYWNEGRPLKISRWIIPLIIASSAHHCGARQCCLWLCVCVYAMCLRIFFTHYNLRRITAKAKNSSSSG